MEKAKLLKLSHDALLAAIPDFQYVMPGTLPVVNSGHRPDGMLYVEMEWEDGEFPRNTWDSKLEALVDVSASDPSSENGDTTQWLVMSGLVGRGKSARDVVLYVQTSSGPYCDENFDATGQVTVYVPQDDAAAKKLVGELKRQIAEQYARDLVPSVNAVKELLELEPPVQWDIDALLGIAQRVHGNG